MEIHTIVSALVGENCYLVVDGDEFLIIDPGQGSAKKIAEYAQQRNLTPVAILLTHGHVDHAWDTRALAKKYQIPTYIHSKDRPQLADPISGLSPQFSIFLCGLKFKEPRIIEELDDKTTLIIGNFEVQVRKIPGHTPGSVAFIIGDAVFTGDALFDMSIGRSDFPGGNHQQLIESITSQLLTLPDHYRVFSGHGPETTIGKQRNYNPFLVTI